MREMSPCKDCPDRHPACHDSCEKYKAWRDRYQAQQQHLKDQQGRWCMPGSVYRDKKRDQYRRSARN